MKPKFVLFRSDGDEMKRTKKPAQGEGGSVPVIEHLPPGDLTAYERNSRTHSEAQVEQIVNSIREFGFTNPVLIDANGEIIAGHGRHAAALKMELPTVPCVRLSHLSDAQKRAYVIADNQIALNSGWDTELLANELSDLHADDLDLALLGFEADQLSKLLDIDVGLSDATAPDDFKDDENIETEHECPKCGYAWSGKA